MDSVYENSGFKLSAVSSDEKCSQYKGNQVTSSKWTKVLLIVLCVSLVLALGGLCVLGIMYVSVSMQLSSQETNSTIMVKELTDNYTRVGEQLFFYNVKVKELTDNYTRVREQLFFYKAFTAQLRDWGGKLYYFSSDQLTWSSSRAFCVSKGADLVTITSQAEQMFLYSELKDHYWIGLNDLVTEGHWVWVNSQTLTETGVQKVHIYRWGPFGPIKQAYCVHYSSTEGVLQHFLPYKGSLAPKSFGSRGSLRKVNLITGE